MALIAKNVDAPRFLKRSCVGSPERYPAGAEIVAISAIL
jgi:hypothetical protein